MCSSKTRQDDVNGHENEHENTNEHENDCVVVSED